MGVERRKYVRFLAQDNAFAALRGDFRKVGIINDISIKGLGFSYLSKTFEDTNDYDSLSVDIFLSGNGFHLSNIPCMIAYDTPDVGIDKNSSLSMFRCGLKFKKLKENQLDQLEFFLKNYTTGISAS